MGGHVQRRLRPSAPLSPGLMPTGRHCISGVESTFSSSRVSYAVEDEEVEALRSQVVRPWRRQGWIGAGLRWARL